jgi:hypothetical protein
LRRRTRRPSLDHQLELLSGPVKRQYEDDSDTDAALVPDGLGIGSGSDVVVRAGASNGRRAVGGAPVS